MRLPFWLRWFFSSEEQTNRSPTLVAVLKATGKFVLLCILIAVAKVTLSALLDRGDSSQHEEPAWKAKQGEHKVVAPYQPPMPPMKKGGE